MRTGLTVQRDQDNFKLFDLLLIVGLTLAPMTGFRAWRVGPAEILCLLWGIRSLLKWRFRRSDTLSFFAVFLIVLALGYVVCSFIAPSEASLTGLLTWLYLAIIAMSLYEGLSKRSLYYVEKLLRIFSVTAILWYLFLYGYGRYVSRTFLGAPLWYYSRFSGGATNPHQVAVMLCGLSFVFVRQILNRRKVLPNLLFAAASVFLLLQTASSTGILAFFIGALICIYLFFINAFPRKKVQVAIVMTLILILVGLFIYSFVYDRFMAWVASDSNGMGRLRIFASFPETFAKSPIVGLGPGTHGENGYIEFHNTYLEIAAASGFIGSVAFLLYTVRIFKKTLHGDWRLLPIVVAMYAYGLAGFAMRRLVYWGILMFVLVIAEKKIALQNENPCQEYAEYPATEAQTGMM